MPVITLYQEVDRGVESEAVRRAIAAYRRSLMKRGFDIGGAGAIMVEKYLREKWDSQKVRVDLKFTFEELTVELDRIERG